MAELGNLLSGGEDAEKKEEVNVEMLDYSYVNSCTDVKKLRAIVDVLASGSEGLYPDVSNKERRRAHYTLPVLNHLTDLSPRFPNEIAAKGGGRSPHVAASCV